MVTSRDLTINGEYWVIRKDLFRTLGAIETPVLAELIWLRQRSGGGEFEACNDHFEEEMCLTPYQVRKALETLESKGIIRIEYKGLPKRRFVTIDDESLKDILGHSAYVIGGKTYPPEEQTEEQIEDEAKDDVKTISELADLAETSNLPAAPVYRQLAELNPDFIWTANDLSILLRVKEMARIRIRQKRRKSGEMPTASEREAYMVIAGMMRDMPEFYREIVPYNLKVLETNFNSIASHYRR